ncbi:MAG: Yip1 family protein [Pseudomonadota bacterium]
MSEQNLSLSPFIMVWTAPRRTIRHVVATSEVGIAYLLAGLAGIADLITRDNQNFPETLGALLVTVTGGFLTGLLVVFLGGYLLRWTGRWIGGTGELRDIRLAYGWSSVPKVVTAAIVIGAWFVLGPSFYSQPDSAVDAIIIVAIVVLSIWSVVLHVHCLGEVQGFSAWKGLGNSILAGLVVVIPLATVIIIISVISSSR